MLDAQAPGQPLPSLRAEVSSLLDQATAQVANLRQAFASLTRFLVLD